VCPLVFVSRGVCGRHIIIVNMVIIIFITMSIIIVIVIIVIITTIVLSIPSFTLHACGGATQLHGIGCLVLRFRSSVAI
jgi:hypothetical protein